MTDQTATAADAYEGWAIVELMGHRVVAGRVSEASQYGASMLRVDVPMITENAIAVTQFYGGSAIYAMTPCDEAAARKVLERRYNLPEPVRLALPEPQHPDLALHHATDEDEDPLGDEY